MHGAKGNALLLINLHLTLPVRMTYYYELPNIFTYYYELPNIFGIFLSDTMLMFENDQSGTESISL